jgi:hypothetical protein
MKSKIKASVLAAPAVLVVTFGMTGIASAIPNPGTRVAQSVIASDPSPYQEGYAKGVSDGYADGDSNALKLCADDGKPWPEVPEGAYGVGYLEGYQLGYNRGLSDGTAKYCRPS